jgi:[ribosomal protein S18]-alanine N-acetyltransferase
MTRQPARRGARRTLRPARSSDVPDLTVFEARAFTGYYAAHRFSRQQFRYYLARASTVAYVVSSRGAIVGYALGIQQTGRLSHVARLLSIGVDRGYRGRGVGARLLARFLEAARKRGCRSVFLEVASSNGVALGLFSRIGFSAVESLQGHYSSAVSGTRMRLTLQRSRTDHV